MSVKKRVWHIVGLTAEAIASAETPSNWHVPVDCATLAEGTRLWSRDYGVALRRTLSRAKVAGNYQLRETQSVAASERGGRWNRFDERIFRAGVKSGRGLPVY